MTYEEALHAHVHAFFGKHRCATRTWAGDTKLREILPGFHVIEVGPGPRTNRWTYVSVGAGTTTPDNGRNLELLLCAHSPEERHVQLLYMTAFYHLTGEALDIGHTFSIGQPWLPGSTLDCFLVSLPYPFGPALEVFESESHHAHLLWLTPITKAERAFAAEAGPDALEGLLERKRVDYSDPMRRSAK